MLLSRWKLPEGISNAIAAHHQAEIPEGTNVKDVAMLRVADLMSQELEMETEGNPVTPEPNETDLEILNMKEKDLIDIREHLKGAEKEIYDLFSAMS